MAAQKVKILGRSQMYDIVFYKLVCQVNFFFFFFWNEDSIMVLAHPLCGFKTFTVCTIQLMGGTTVTGMVLASPIALTVKTWHSPVVPVRLMVT